MGQDRVRYEPKGCSSLNLDRIVGGIQVCELGKQSLEGRFGCAYSRWWSVVEEGLRERIVVARLLDSTTQHVKAFLIWQIFHIT